MFWTFNLSLDILAADWATFPNIGRIFVHFSCHSACKLCLGCKRFPGYKHSSLFYLPTA